MNPEYDYLFKLLLIGDSGVGKSCLLLRFAVLEIIYDQTVESWPPGCNVILKQFQNQDADPMRS